MTVRTAIARLGGGATEETIIARVGEGIIATIGAAESHKAVLEQPDRISKTVLHKGLDSGTAFEILSIDIAEIELSVLARQCLHQRIGSLEELKELLKIWKKQRNAESHTISWRFKTEDARIKLRRLYPVLSSEE